MSAGNVYIRLAQSGATILINGTGAAKATTAAFTVPSMKGCQFSYQIKASGTTPRVSIKLLASYDGTNYVVPDDMSSALITITDSNRHIKAFSPTYAMSYKVQIDGDASNGADTLIDELFIGYTRN